MVKGIKERFLTMTVDNGREFAGHKEISSRLNVDVYFAHPYHSWERGLNENTNGLLRQFFPKKTDLRKISDQKVEHVQHMLNNRPRKLLNFMTPYDVIKETKYESIAIAGVTNVNWEEFESDIDELIHFAYEDNIDASIRMLKKLVPEYNPQNEIYQSVLEKDDRSKK